MEQPLEKQLLCSVCLQRFIKPKLLPCLHTFCVSCLEDTRAQQQENAHYVNCPTCMNKCELPVGGISQLPPNFFIQNLIELSELQTRNSQLICDLCASSEPAVSRCMNCCFDLCHICAEAHKRQKRTFHHNIVGIQTIPASPSTNNLFCCKIHPRCTVATYCEDCMELVCSQCYNVHHLTHQTKPLALCYDTSGGLEDLLTMAQHRITSLNDTARNIQLTIARLKNKAAKVSAEICDDIDRQMCALQEHKKTLLSQVNTIKSEKESMLLLQLETIKEVNTHIKSSYNHVTRLLKSHRDKGLSDGLSRHPQVRELDELLLTRVNTRPAEDDYIRFSSGTPAGPCAGYEMNGIVDAKGPSAANSYAKGEGLITGRQNCEASFLVVVCDRFGQQRQLGGDQVEIRIAVINSPKDEITSKITDNCNGKYKVMYTPWMSEELLVSVLVAGKHIRGSPFRVSILPSHS